MRVDSLSVTLRILDKGRMIACRLKAIPLGKVISFQCVIFLFWGLR